MLHRRYLIRALLHTRIWRAIIIILITDGRGAGRDGRAGRFGSCPSDVLIGLDRTEDRIATSSWAVCPYRVNVCVCVCVTSTKLLNNIVARTIDPGPRTAATATPAVHTSYARVCRGMSLGYRALRRHTSSFSSTRAHLFTIIFTYVYDEAECESRRRRVAGTFFRRTRD